MNIDKLITLTITKARKEQDNKKWSRGLSHPNHIAFYAWQQYEYIRERNLELPEIPELRRIGNDTQFSYDQSEVMEAMRMALLADA